jgi:hypothetical protein
MFRYEKEMADTKILRCTNKDQIRNLSRYLQKVKHKWFNKTKEVYIRIISIEW